MVVCFNQIFKFVNVTASISTRLAKPGFFNYSAFLQAPQTHKDSERIFFCGIILLNSACAFSFSFGRLENLLTYIKHQFFISIFV